MNRRRKRGLLLILFFFIGAKHESGQVGERLERKDLKEKEEGEIHCKEVGGLCVGEGGGSICSPEITQTRPGCL